MAERNKFRMLLHDNVRPSFTSKKAAVLFQNALNNWLSDMAFKINESYILAWVSYRRLWLYYDFDLDEEKRISIQFDIIEKSMNRIYFYQAPGKGATLVYSRMFDCLNTLIAIYDNLEKKQRARNNWEAIKLIEFERARLNAYIEELNRWPDGENLL